LDVGHAQATERTGLVLSHDGHGERRALAGPLLRPAENHRSSSARPSDRPQECDRISRPSICAVSAPLRWIEDTAPTQGTTKTA